MVVGTNNLAIEHDTTELITLFHSESTAQFNDINISYCGKIPKIGENPLIIVNRGYSGSGVIRV